jgi:methionyl aminopeptidase
MSVELKSARELEAMRQAGRVNAEVRALLMDAVRPGVTGTGTRPAGEGGDRESGGEPTFVGYAPGEAALPGRDLLLGQRGAGARDPDDRVLQEGDIVSIDLGVTYGDSCRTRRSPRPWGGVRRGARADGGDAGALWAGIEAAAAGNRLGDVSHAIGQGSEDGTGSSAATAATVWAARCTWSRTSRTTGVREPGLKLMPGMVLALEPMFSIGDQATEETDDEWTVVMSDGSLSAHFEETVAITATVRRY